MNRGDPKETSGFVNFPTRDQRYRQTGEGGLFVQLVALPMTRQDFMVCDGGSFQCLAEPALLVGDDVTVIPPPPPQPDQPVGGLSGLRRRALGLFGSNRGEDDAMSAYRERVQDLRDRLPRYYYPGRAKVYDIPPEKKPLSIDYYAILTLGSTGWVGYDDQHAAYWNCSYKDLTEDGRAIYDALTLLYGDAAQLVLQTWLDH